jgi:hypothetical protein
MMGIDVFLTRVERIEVVLQRFDLKSVYAYEVLEMNLF